MTQQKPRSEDDVYKRCMSRYSVSFMSNTKWRRLFAAVQNAALDLSRVQWRFLDTSQAIWISFPSANDVLETGFADGKFQPCGYRWIEWVFIPREYAVVEGVGLRRQQDITGLRRAIDQAGQFELEETDAGLTIHAYKK